MVQYFQCEQKLLINGIWTYTITNLEIFAMKVTSDVDSG